MSELTPTELTPDQIAVVRATAATAVHAQATAAALFRDRALQVAPQIAPVLEDYASAQVAAGLMRMVETAEDLGCLTPPARNLAARLLAHGVTPAQYEGLCDAALWALKQTLGPAFTQEAETAWDALLHALAGPMVASAYPRLDPLAAE